jgi:hypothetical protein
LVHGYGVARQVARTAGAGKGGRLASATLGVKVTHQAAQGGVRISKALGNFHLWLLVDKDGAQGFIAAMQGLSGCEEEATAAGILQYWHSEL